MFRNLLSKPLGSRVSNQRGMTLIEIIIVVTILGTLGAILVSKIAAQLNKAKFNEAKLRMSQVTRALDMYYTDCGKYPAALEGLLQKDECSNWGPEAYMKNKKDLQDAWQHEFTYAPEGSNYVIKSMGADGREGGSGYDADISNADE